MRNFNKSIWIIFWTIFFVSLNSKIADCNSRINPDRSNDSVHVLHYDLYLDVTNFAGKIIIGHTRLSISAKNTNIQTLELDLLKLNIDSINYENSSIPFVYNDTNIFIQLPAPLTSLDTSIVDVYYHGVPKVETSGWGGFHFSGNNLAYNLGIALEDIPHNYARVWFPSIDNFTDKSTYDFFIRVPDPLVAVCNGNLIAATPASNNTSEYHWQLNVPCNAYMASVAISNYVPVSGIFNSLSGPIPTNIYVKPQDTAKARSSFIHLNDVLTAFENWFGPYCWPRVGYVATTQGAMEHPTNIAYPNSSIDGTLADEGLYVHELTHMWFGDLVTCSSPEDMWINEGWGVFGEILFREAVYGKASYKTYMRKKLREVLQLTHVKDNGYLALAPMPQSITYGSTVYDKGGIVTHTLRGYLGDSLFFATVKKYLIQYKFKSISSIQLRDLFTTESGINLTDFFNSWVFTPGFPHFGIDSVRSLPQGNNYFVTVYLRQRHKGTMNFSDKNRLDIRFYGQAWEKFNDSLSFSGQFGSKSFLLPFNPVCSFIDPEEKISDATTDNYTVVKNTGSVVFPDTYFTMDVQQTTDSSLVRITHNWVAPDSFPHAVPGLRLSNYRFWTVEGLLKPSFIAKGRFTYSKSNYLDNTLITNSQDSLVLLYRPSTAETWKSVNFIKNGSFSNGELIVDTLKTGEYTLAIWDHTFLSIAEDHANAIKLRIFPNPASDYVSVYISQNSECILQISDTSGVILKEVRIPVSPFNFNWSPILKAAGTYYFRLKNAKGQTIAAEKILFVN